MDKHEDDISILPDTEEDLSGIDEDGSGLSPFRLSSVDIPASTHALQAAYNDLKKRYNACEQRNKALRRQTRENSAQRMAFESSFLSGENCTLFGSGMAEPGAAAMADSSSSGEEMAAKQGVIDHLTRQVTLGQKKALILEAELKHARQNTAQLEVRLLEAERLRAELTRTSRELEEVRGRNALEVRELKDNIRSLNQQLAVCRQRLTSTEESYRQLQEEMRQLRLSGKSPGMLSELKSECPGPSSFPGRTGVVSMSEFQAVKAHMAQCQENMVKLRQVVEQQKELIRVLQADQLSKDSTEWDLASELTSKDAQGKSQRVHQDDSSQESAPRRNPTPRTDLTVDQALSPTGPKGPGPPQAPHPRPGTLRDAAAYSEYVQNARQNLERVSRNRAYPPGDADTESVELPPPAVPKASIPGVVGCSWPRREPVQSTEYVSAGEAEKTDWVAPPPRESSPPPDRHLAAASRHCPVCGVNFTHLTMSDFQSHVFECYDDTESGERMQAALMGTGMAPGADNPNALRICPVCATDFHSDIPQDLFERHVYEHFGEPPNIVDDFAVLHP